MPEEVDFEDLEDVEEEKQVGEEDKNFFFDVFRSKPCPTVPIQQNFKVDRFAGRWYEIYSSKRLDRCLEKMIYGSKNNQCSTKNFTKRDDGVLEEIESTTQIIRKFKNEIEKVSVIQTGRAQHLQIPEKEGKFVIKNQKGPNNWDNFDVLSTDYTSYAVLYKCQNKLFNRVRK